MAYVCGVLDCREGVEASRRGVDLNIFRLADFQIPYGYAPVLVAEAHTIRRDGYLPDASVANF